MNPFEDSIDPHMSQSKTFLDLNFQNESDYQRCKTFFFEYCMMVYPSLDQEYRFQERIGNGS
jgi:hypothetical protein